MDKLNQDNEKEYLQSGKMTQPFWDDKVIQSAVVRDYLNKLESGQNISPLNSLYCWIHHNVKYFEPDGQHLQFNRTAEEIWESKKSTGCTDYALLFCTFARQLGIPTTLLHTVQQECFDKLKVGEKAQHIGHSFCECFYEGNWILFDPATGRITKEYDPNKIVLSYKLGGSDTFVAYLRGQDLGGKQTVEEHNKEMDERCSLL